MSVVDISSPDQLEQVVRAAGPGRVVVRFHRPGCPACVRIGPAYQSIANRRISALGRPVVFVDIDTSRNQALAKEFKVLAVPTFMSIDAGRFKSRFAGADEAHVLRLANTGL